MTVENVAEAIAARKKRSAVTQLYRDYYDGNPHMEFASKAFRDHYHWVLSNARENLCEAVVSSFTGNVGLQSWQGEGGKTATLLARTVKLNKVMNMTHDESYITGDGYVIVWPDRRGQNRPYVQSADEMYVSCEPGTNTVDWAAKLWTYEAFSQDEQRKVRRARVNVYTEVGCERYYAPGFTVTADAAGDDSTLWPENPSSWYPFDLDGDGPFIPRPPGIGGTGVHWFPHNQRRMGQCGRSILRNVVPIQDGLNHSLATLIVGAEAFAQPLRLILGHTDDEDQVVRIVDGEMQVAEKRTLRIDPTEETIIGVPPTPEGQIPSAVQLDPPDATRLTAIQDSFALKIARIVGLPSYYLTQASGDVPSGQALRVLRERLSSEVADFEQDVSDEWASVMADLGGGVAEPEWLPPAPLDPLEIVQIAEAKKRIGYPFEELLIDLGEKPEDIARILQKKAEDQARQQELFQQQQQSGLRFLQGNDGGGD